MKFSRRATVLGTASTAVGWAITRSASAQSTPESSPSSDETRLVKHAMGETSVPVRPQRVVALEGPVLDACVQLGVIPFGATTGVADAPWPSYLGDQTASIVNVGTIVEPDLEKIASLQPDLIISLKSRHEEIYPQLSAIAPTVFAERSGSDWRASFLVYADALNANDRVDAIVSSFDDRCQQIAADFGSQLAETTVSLVRIYSNIIYSYQLDSFSGSILQEIGLPRPESQQDPTKLAVEVPIEQLQSIDASAMFYMVWGDQASADHSTTLVSNPLWQTLRVVQNNRVFPVSDDHWMVAIGYLAANLVLEDISSYLLEGKEPSLIAGT